MMTSEQQDAWRRISTGLIFVDPVDMDLTKLNVPWISEALQSQFINVMDDKYDKMQSEFRLIIKNIEFTINAMTEVTGAITPPDKEKDINWNWTATSASERENRKMSTVHIDPNKTATENVQSLLTSIYLKVYDGSNDSYNGVGFTPKLCAASSGQAGVNCFGSNMYLGAMLNMIGIKPYLGMSSDHPCIFAEVDGKTWLYDAIGRSRIARGTVYECDGYFIYKPRKIDGREHRMMFVHDYDRAIVYEVLENLKAFRSYLLGNEESLLPYTRKAVTEAIEPFGEDLMACDWGAIQAEIFPEIHRSFLMHKEWKSELLRMQTRRRRQFARIERLKALVPIKEAALTEAFIYEKKEDAEKILRQITNVTAKKLLHGDFPCGDERVRKFYGCIRDSLSKEPDGAKMLSILTAMCVRRKKKKRSKRK